MIITRCIDCKSKELRAWRSEFSRSDYFLTCVDCNKTLVIAREHYLEWMDLP